MRAKVLVAFLLLAMPGPLGCTKESDDNARVAEAEAEKAKAEAEKAKAEAEKAKAAQLPAVEQHRDPTVARSVRWSGSTPPEPPPTREPTEVLGCWPRWRNWTFTWWMFRRATLRFSTEAKARSR